MARHDEIKRLAHGGAPTSPRRKMIQRQPDDDEVRFTPPTCANQSLSCQLLVVGGGLSGLSATEAAMRRGVDVILIEKSAFGQEAASALNAGQFLTGWAKPVDVMLEELTAQEQERGAAGTNSTIPGGGEGESPSAPQRGGMPAAG